MNQPRGDKFVTRGKKKAKAIVKVKTEKGVVTRIRGKSVNLYKIGKAKYKAFGTGKVPEPVQQLLNVDSLNFQRQHDALFMFSDTPGQVSKRLNQIFDLGSIDLALSNIATMSRKARSEFDVSTERLQEAQTQVKELEWAVEFHSDVQGLLALEKRKGEIASRIALLTVLTKNASKYKRRHDLASKTILDAAKLITLGRRAEQKQQQSKTLVKLIGQAEDAYEVLKKPIPDMEELLSVRGDADLVAEKHRTLESLVDQAIKAKERLCLLRKKLKRSEKKLPKNCRTCGQPIQSSSSGLTYTSHSKHH